jgi:hypothetical protein
LKFEGFSFKNKLMEFDTCLNSIDSIKSELAKEDKIYEIRTMISERQALLDGLIPEYNLQPHDYQGTIVVDRKDYDNLKLAKREANMAWSMIVGLDTYLEHIKQFPFEGEKFACPMVNKDLAKVIFLLFYVFYAIVIFFIFARKCCPSNIE